MAPTVLKATPSHSHSDTSSDVPAAAGTAEKPNLLIVDDEEGPRQSLRIVFKHDYNVYLASSGQEALVIARKVRIHVAVCDILMAGMSGVELLRELKDLDSKIEVVMLTAYETLETARQALRLGASDYLNKPFDIASMRAAVAKAVQKNLTAAQLEQTHRQMENLAQQIAEYRLQEEMERTKGEIYASVLHDINSPLTVISGFIEMINQTVRGAASLEGENLETIKSDLQYLTGEVSRCFEISRRYLRFLNQDASEDMSSDVKQILSDMSELLRKHPAAHEHQLSIQQLDSSVIARINGTDLLQILLNLTFNALQATHKPHEVAVTCEQHAQGIVVDGHKDTTAERFVTPARFNAGGPLVSFTISDTGPGIPPEALARMFEERFTTKAPGRGTGFGLTIVKRLVGHAEGAVRVATSPGAGSSFTVFVPLRR